MQPVAPSEPFVVAGPAGTIVGRLEPPPARAALRFVAVFAHPHPQYGGTMQNRVVVRGARALAAIGGAVARFNFRGVEGSEGRYDLGRGEVDDVVAVLAWIEQRFPGSACRVAAGFSFGSIRAFEACARGAADAWLGVAPPLLLPQPVPLPRLEAPAAIVLAGEDVIARAASPAQLAERCRDLRALEVVAEADHFFSRRSPELAAAVTAAGEALLAAPR